MARSRTLRLRDRNRQPLHLYVTPIACVSVLRRRIIPVRGVHPNPCSPRGIQSLKNVCELQRNFSSEDLCVLAIGRLCGFTWDPGKRVAGYSSLVSQEKEIVNMENS
jgi:hypothetical protein